MRQIESCFSECQTPEIPKGMERCFPFFLNIEIPVHHRNESIAMYKYEPAEFGHEFETAAFPGFPHRYIKGGIPICDLISGPIVSGQGRLGMQHHNNDSINSEKFRSDKLAIKRKASEMVREVDRNILRNQNLRRVLFNPTFEKSSVAIHQHRTDLQGMQETTQKGIKMSCTQNYPPDERANTENVRDGTDFAFVSSRLSFVTC